MIFQPTDSIPSGPGSSPYFAKTTSANAAATPPPEGFGHIDESDGEVIIIVGFVAIIAVALLAGFCLQARKSGDVSWGVLLNVLLDSLEPSVMVLTIFVV